MTHEIAKALADSGYMSVAEYVRLCRENNWVA
jgi:hypothetical protein